MRSDLFLPIFAYPKCILLILLIENPSVAGGPGGAPWNGQYGNVLPERGTFIALEEHKRVGFLRIKAT